VTDPKPPSRASLGVLLFTVFLDLVGFGMVIPILPTYAESLHASDLSAGILLASYSAMQLIFSPIWGRVSDRYGRRPVLLVSILGSSLSQLGYAYAPTLGWLIAARSLAGICGANITAAQAYIADVTDGKSRAAAMGLFGAALGSGFVVGPTIGGLLEHYAHSASLPFFVASGLALINFFLALAILPEPRTAAERSEARALSWRAVVETAREPKVVALIVVFFVVTLGFANLESTFSFFLERRYGWGRRETSFIFAYIGVVLIFTQGFLVRRLVPRFGERSLIVAGTLLMAAGFLLQTQSEKLPMLFVSVAVVAIGNGLNNPSLAALVSRAAGADRQGGVLGVNQAAGALARIAGPLMGTSLMGFGINTPYFAGAALMVLGSFVAVARVTQPRD
jgi:multidrug resistance protein